MLAESFLRVLHYREERKFASGSIQQNQTQIHDDGADPLNNARGSDSTDLKIDSAEAGAKQDELDSTQTQGLRVFPPGDAGLSIPGCSPGLTLHPDFTVCLDDCSLLDQYPDLQVADSGRIRGTSTQQILYTPFSEVQHHLVRQEPQVNPVTSIPDQGYLAIGNSENISLDLPGSGLEPMSNSVLNGLLEKQLEEVYMQHLTDNLARCHSHLGNSLLHGLVLPPQSSSQTGGTDSLEASLEEASGAETEKKISYLNTQNIVACSSNFSSPVLRISETDL